MLRSLKDLERYTVTATDGDVGGVVNFLLDDEHWVVRYLVVETAGPSGPPPVLISPIFFRHVDWATHTFGLALTMDKVKNSPSIDVDRPVSRQHERDYYGYYGYPYYWGYMAPWGASAYPALLAAGKRNRKACRACRRKTSGDVHLRSASEVRGYHIQGSDECDRSYRGLHRRRRKLGSPLPGGRHQKLVVRQKVLVAPHWASGVSWAERKVYVDLSREAIKKSPEWNPTAGVNREYETRLYDYYGRPAYWFTDGGGKQVFGPGGTAPGVSREGTGRSAAAASTRDKGR